jgi:hypothetical protein
MYYDYPGYFDLPYFYYNPYYHRYSTTYVNAHVVPDKHRPQRPKTRPPRPKTRPPIKSTHPIKPTKTYSRMKSKNI